MYQISAEKIFIYSLNEKKITQNKLLLNTTIQNRAFKLLKKHLV